MPFNYVKKLRVPEEGDIEIAMAEDINRRKINAFRQSYRTESGLPLGFPIVKEVQKKLPKEIYPHEENIPSFGLSEFRDAVTELVLGKENIRVTNGQVFTVQTLSREGALRIISEIAWKHLKLRHFYMPASTYDGSRICVEAAGFPTPKTYRYYDRVNHELDMEGMIEDLRAIPPDSLVMFYACCHNPTGCDPTVKQWTTIAESVGMNVFPIVDLSYQGLATGDPDIDAYPIKFFARLGIEMAVTITFDHNFLLYNDRVGAAMFILHSSKDIPALQSHLAYLIESLYGQPPYSGAKIVATVLKNPEYFEEWIGYVNKIKDQTQSARDNFVRTIKRLNVPGNWDYISRGKGMYTMTDLTDRQVQHLILYHHVYMRKKNASLSIGSFTPDMIEYVAEAIADSIIAHPKVDDNDTYIIKDTLLNVKQYFC